MDDLEDFAIGTPSDEGTVGVDDEVAVAVVVIGGGVGGGVGQVVAGLSRHGGKAATCAEHTEAWFEGDALTAFEYHTFRASNGTAGNDAVQGLDGIGGGNGLVDQDFGDAGGVGVGNGFGRGNQLTQ